MKNGDVRKRESFVICHQELARRINVVPGRRPINVSRFCHSLAKATAKPTPYPQSSDLSLRRVFLCSLMSPLQARGHSVYHPLTSINAVHVISLFAPHRSTHHPYPCTCLEDQPYELFLLPPAPPPVYELLRITSQMARPSLSSEFVSKGPRSLLGGGSRTPSSTSFLPTLSGITSSQSLSSSMSMIKQK